MMMGDRKMINTSGPNALLAKSIITATLIFCTLLISGCSTETKLRLSGNVEGDNYTVRSEVSGTVTEVLKKEGDSIQKGEALLVLDSSMQQLIVKQQEAIVRGKKEKLKEAQNESVGSESVIAQLTADVDAASAQLEQANLLLRKHKIIATVTGVYTNRFVQIGDIISVGTAVATLTNPEERKVSFYIPQSYLDRIQLNQKVDLEITGRSDDKLQGTITFIAGEADFSSENAKNSINNDNSSFKFIVQIDKELDLKPGMTVDAVIPLE
ncbi:efflux RND transporter periplasmic adaptor subunit [Paenibacillus sp. GCM10012306]|uniref:efflux RND transporter periplasmic adaptor subunit n=1 Tax=Paenibacillus sp. GCM10012306 TaxID=3317342 RepID=UPI00360AD1D7